MNENKSKAVDVLNMVKEKLASSASDVQSRLVDSLTNKEIQDRVALLTRSLEKLKELKKAFDKIKPDLESYDENEKLIGKSFSKAKNEEKKKTREKMDKLDSAVTKALNLENPEAFQKLKEALDKS